VVDVRAVRDVDNRDEVLVVVHPIADPVGTAPGRVLPGHRWSQRFAHTSGAVGYSDYSEILSGSAAGFDVDC
jgi:hypothetical protein